MRRLLFHLNILILYFLAFVLGVYFYVGQIGGAAVSEGAPPAPAQAIVIPGASVLPGGAVSDVLRRRLDRGFSLYNAGLAPKIIVTGGHEAPFYDEAGAMRDYLAAKGVPNESIIVDNEGFNTFKSVLRAKEIFKMSRVIIVTQRFQLVRALYLAARVGLFAEGVSAGEAGGLYWKNRLRELGARVKAFFEAGVFKTTMAGATDKRA